MNEEKSLSQKRLTASPGTLAERWHSLPLLLFMVAMGVICVLLARPFFSALAWAVALSVVLAPANRFFARGLRSRNLAAGLTVVLVALVLSAVAVALLPGLVQTAVDGLDALEVQIQSGTPAQILEKYPRLGEAWRWVEAKADLAQAVKQVVGYASALAPSILQGSLVGLVEALLTLFFLFYFLRDQELAVQLLRSMLPMSASEIDEFLAWQVDTLYATLYGTLLVGFIQGLLGGLMFWWLGLNAPVFWGMVMGVLCMLPVVGPSLVWGPAALLLGLSGHWLKAILLTTWGSVFIGLIGNLLYPILLGRRLRLHTVAVFISMIGGLILFGGCGFFVGPVALAAALSLHSIWKARVAVAGSGNPPNSQSPGSDNGPALVEKPNL